MDWKTQFRDYILERGRKYYQNNRVSGLSYKDGLYRARVLGEVPYNVEVKVKDDQISYMKCSCPHAAAGNRCKHMAAMMYAIEASGDMLQATEEAKEEKAFQKKDKKAYRYFDMERITADAKISSGVLTAAKKLVQEKRVVLDSVSTGYRQLSQDEELCATARGSISDKWGKRQLLIQFDSEEILYAVCDVLGCAGGYNPYYYWEELELCEHLVALLLLVDEYIEKYNPGDSTDAVGSVLLNKLRVRNQQELMEKNIEVVEDLVLEPLLENVGDYLKAGFRIGCEKMYVVKNLTELVEAYDKKDAMPLGTKAQIDFAKHRFAEKSEKLYRFIQGVVREERERFQHIREQTRQYTEEEKIKNRIDLYGERLEKFYDLTEGTRVTYTDKGRDGKGKRELLVKEDTPDIALQVEKYETNDGVFEGVYVWGEVPKVISGMEHQYFVTDDAFCRLSKESEPGILPILEMEENGEVSFCVGRKHLSEFYYQALPALKRNMTVEEIDVEEMQEFIPPEPVFSFYIDAEKQNVMCKARVAYGEHQFTLLEHYRKDAAFEEYRNTSIERSNLQEVRELFPEVDLENDELHCGSSEELVFRILESGIEKLLSMGEVHTTDRFRNLNIRRKPKLKIGVSVESDIMNLSISSDDIPQDELLDILRSYRRKKKYYRLKNGDFVAVNETDMEMLSEMMETLHLSPKEFTKGQMQVPVYRALYLNKMLEESDNVYANRDKHFKQLIKEFKTVEDSEFDIPSSLGDIMRKYQIQGFRWMKTLEHYGFGGILADDMGLGKTLQMISILLSAKENGYLGTALIVCPASLVYNWKEEFLRFAPELQVTTVVGNQQERVEIIKEYHKSDVLITSYDLLKRDIAEYEGITFDYQVIDEAQYIKNHTTAASKSVKIIQSKQRFALTGTPIENRLSELWSIFDYLMPGFLYSYEVFRKELETPIVKHKDETASAKLKKMVAPFILRRLKGDVLRDLPEKIEEIRYARLEDKQQKLYDGQVVHMQEILAGQDADDFQKNKLLILAELTKIRQICCDPGLLFERYEGGSAKREACVELIQSAIEGEHKILIFSQFTSMLELLEQDLKREAVSYYKITGATPKEKRVELVNAFNSDATPVFLISLKAGGTGLNLTGADVVIHYDPWWNQAVQNQATDRAHRIGQTKVVSVYKLIAKDTIEEKIVKMQESKRDLADSILSGDSGGITQMSKDELMDLLMG